jgi:hypothetical protein
VKPISYNPRDTFLNDFVQLSVCIITISLIMPETFGISPFGLIIASAILAFLSAFSPYMGVYKKISVLYKDDDNNLYVDKVLVDKRLITSIKRSSQSWHLRGADFFIMSFQDLPSQVKAINFNRNSIVYSQIQSLSNWPNCKDKTQMHLKELGIDHEVQYVKD